MKVTYIGHSGFSVELDHYVLLFDYYTGKLPEWPGEKTLLVFASHSHPDHFNWKVLLLAEKYPHIHFFLGNDIRLGENWLALKGIGTKIKEKVTKLAGHRQAVFGEGGDSVRVDTLTSTDAGVAFLVEAGGRRIYHAGDLNWWHQNAGPKEENDAMEAAFKKEMAAIAGQHFDVAFVPLDPRQEGCYDWGMNCFLENTDSPVVFPMHLWGNYGIVDIYRQSVAGRVYADRVRKVCKGGQEWNI